MSQKHLNAIIILASVLIVSIALFLSIYKQSFNKKTATWTNIPSTSLQKGVYKAESFCGEFHFIRKIADDFDEALKIFRNEKTLQFKSNCPGNPCNDIELTTKKVQGLTDLNGKPVGNNLYLISIQDKSTKILIQNVSDAIDDKGVLYDVPWCSD